MGVWEALIFCVSLTFLISGCLLFLILLRYYQTIPFINRNTITYLSLFLICILILLILVLVNAILDIIYEQPWIFFYVIQNVSLISFIIIGPVPYPVAVFIRSSYFCALLMFDFTVITICFFRQLIIFAVR